MAKPWHTAKTKPWRCCGRADEDRTDPIKRRPRPASWCGRNEAGGREPAGFRARI